MSHIKIHTVLGLASIFYANSFAQSQFASIETIVEGGNLAVVSHKGSLYASENSDIKYTIKLDGVEESSLSYLFTLKKDGSEILSSESIDEVLNKTKNLSNGLYTLNVRVIKSVSEKDETKSDTIFIDAQPVNLVITPHLEKKNWDGGTKQSPAYAWDKDLKTLILLGKDGNEDGWKYTAEFYDGNNLTNSEDKTLSCVFNYSPSLNYQKYEVKNYAPDGSTVWATYLDSCYYKVLELPSASFANKANYMANDEISVPFTTKGGSSSNWSYSWTASYKSFTGGGNSVVTDNCTSSPIKITWDKNTTEERTVTLTLRATNSPAGLTSLTDTIETSFKVYPKATGSVNTQEIVTCGGRNESISVSHSGGYPDGWSCEIKDAQGNLVSSNSSFTLTAENKSQSIINTLYTCKLVNRCEGDVWFEKSYDISVTIYPEPVLNLNFSENDTKNLYVGESTTLTASYHGGDENGWSYSWKLNGEALPVSLEQQTPVHESSQTDNYTFEISNIHNGKSWVKKTYKIAVSTWTKGLAQLNTYRESSYNGLTSDFSVSHEGGYPDGWIYEWYDPKGNLISGQSSSRLGIRYQNEGSSPEVQKYKLVCKNQIDSNVGYQQEFDFSSKIYPKIIAPSSNDSQKAIRVRSVDERSLSFIGGQRGNENGWYYAWNDNPYGQTVSTIKVSYDVIESDVMETLELPYTLHWKNVNPDNTDEIWESGTIEFPVKIYNTPKKPVFRQKGNGNSSIYIVMPYNVKDEELFGTTLQYTFQFGNGEDSYDSIYETDSLRWFKYDEKPECPWVRSCWHYSDWDCVSDRAFPENGTRADFSTIAVYNTDGKLIKAVDSYDELTPNQCIEELSLKPGLYLISIGGSLNKVYVQ